jgi:hypothetical protein
MHYSTLFPSELVCIWVFQEAGRVPGLVTVVERQPELFALVGGL